MGHKLKIAGWVSVGVVAGALTTVSLQTVARGAMTPLPLEEIQQLSAVFGLIKTDYVEPVDDKKLITDAIGGMVSIAVVAISTLAVVGVATIAIVPITRFHRANNSDSGSESCDKKGCFSHDDSPSMLRHRRRCRYRLTPELSRAAKRRRLE